ncbi:hypothetical protein DFJ73DRAFT_766224 [Zopfochytrium polystomum]|nr:hypothetical protein DFJ73DRAFT_766224 [Zopfochytrium polystomum]
MSLLILGFQDLWKRKDAFIAMGNRLAAMQILEIQTKQGTLLAMVVALTASEMGTGTICTVQLVGARALKPAAVSQDWARCLKRWPGQLVWDSRDQMASSVSRSPR